MPPHAAPVRGRLKGHELRAAGGGLAERAARRLQGRAPHACPSTTRANSAGHGARLPARSQKRHLALDVLALGAHLDGALHWLSSLVKFGSFFSVGKRSSPMNA